MTTQFRYNTPVEFINSLADWTSRNLVDELREDTSPSEKVPEPDAPTEAPEELSSAWIALEALRVLKKAETTEFVDEADSLLRVADRYISMMELAMRADGSIS